MSQCTKKVIPQTLGAPLEDWLTSQKKVLEIWLDRLIEEGDPHDLISMLHKQAVWLTLMKKHVATPHVE